MMSVASSSRPSSVSAASGSPGSSLSNSAAPGHVLVDLHDAAAAELRGDLAAAPFVALLLDDLEHDGHAGTLAVNEHRGLGRDGALDRDAPGTRAEHDAFAQPLAGH